LQGRSRNALASDGSTRHGYEGGADKDGFNFVFDNSPHTDCGALMQMMVLPTACFLPAIFVTCFGGNRGRVQIGFALVSRATPS